MVDAQVVNQVLLTRVKSACDASDMRLLRLHPGVGNFVWEVTERHNEWKCRSTFTLKHEKAQRGTLIVLKGSGNNTLTMTIRGLFNPLRRDTDQPELGTEKSFFKIPPDASELPEAALAHLALAIAWAIAQPAVPVNKAPSGAKRKTRHSLAAN